LKMHSETSHSNIAISPVVDSLNPDAIFTFTQVQDLSTSTFTQVQDLSTSTFTQVQDLCIYMYNISKPFNYFLKTWFQFPVPCKLAKENGKTTRLLYEYILSMFTGWWR